jgi:glycosyltransferase involved in cell wall biosynthesis
MRICLAGNAEGNIDEGMKKVTASLAEELHKRHEVLVFNPTKPQRLNAWRAVRRFRPDLVHYVPGPSAASFVIAQALSHLSERSPVVMSALHPMNLRPRWLLRALRPDVILVQSPRAEALFREVGASIQYLPLGVDPTTFHPTAPNSKRALREHYGVDQDAFVILHVGNIRDGRNLRILSDLREPGTEIVVVGSTSVKGDYALLTDLQARGVHVWTHYIREIHEVYQLADLYVFPVRNTVSAMEFPLSVLEAMATNLPVISTPFGALPHYLSECDGLVWLHRDEELAYHVERFRAREVRVSTCTVAQQFAWESIVRTLEGVYTDVLAPTSSDKNSHGRWQL